MNLKDKTSPIYLKLILTACLLFLFTNIAQANNLQIAVNKLEQDVTNHRMNIYFNIQWDHSWRDTQNEVDLASGNYDAVWVFIKYSIDGGLSWKHGRLYSPDTTNLSYSATSGGYSTNGDSNYEIMLHNDPVGAGTAVFGAFVQRASTATAKTGPASINNAVIVWDYIGSGENDGKAAKAIVRVLGIEMVYIPKGKFYVGSGLTSVNPGDDSSNENNSFYTCEPRGSGIIDRYLVKDENIICIGGTRSIDISPLTCSTKDAILQSSVTCGASGTCNLCSKASMTPSNSGTYGKYLDANYPKGYKAFYMMKYEISQNQFRDFFNMLTRTQQDGIGNVATYNTGLYILTGQATVKYRNSLKAFNEVITGEPVIADFDLKIESTDVKNQANDGQYIAQNFLMWTDLTKFADWAGLRPMSELEFEKAARGGSRGNSVSEMPPDSSSGGGNYVFGTATFDPNTITLQANTDGTKSETHAQSLSSSTGFINYNNQISGSILGGKGPLRVGYSAARASGSTFDRANSGGSYYGVMDLSGNVTEMTTPVMPNKQLTFSRDSHGDGDISAQPGDWVVEADAGSRGGSWLTVKDISQDDQARISSRAKYKTVSGVRYSSTQTAAADQGGRCVRSAYEP